MNRDLRPVFWSPVRWIACTAAMFLLQIALIWLLGDRHLVRLPNRAFETAVALQPEIHASVSASEGQEPALLALPDARGFSGEAWLEYQPPQHRLAEWSESPQWLALSAHVATLGEAMSEFAANSRPPPLRAADEPLPWNPASEAPLPPLPLPRESRLEFGGNLALDVSMQLPLLPSWQSNEDVSNSTVRVAFDHTGKPFSCVLLSKSGLKDADEYALNVATSLRFRASEVDGEAGHQRLRFGKLIFHWHTVPSPVVPRGVTSLPRNP